MEDGLRVDMAKKQDYLISQVLILVLMEDGLRVIQPRCQKLQKLS